MKYTGMKRTPFLMLREKEGDWAIVRLTKAGREVPGKGCFWNLAIESMGGMASTTLKDDDGILRQVDVSQGDLVTLLAGVGLNRQLSDALADVGEGGRVKITYTGKKKVRTRFGVRELAQFDVEGV